MVVSFVNAGLITLVESICVIMVANIGTIVTGCVISILGFKISISQYVLPLIGIGFHQVFSKSARCRSIGEILIGVAFLFLRFDFLKAAMPNIDTNTEMLSFLQNYTNLVCGSVLIFLVVGTVLNFFIH